MDKPEAAQQFLASPLARSQSLGAAEAETRVRQGYEAQPLSRENDSPSFWAGAALGPRFPDGLANCTSGIPAVGWDGRTWLVTAAHCYNLWDHVWAMGDGVTSANYIGQVKYRGPGLDAALIEAPTFRNTYDCCVPNITSRYLSGTGNKAINDFVCQLGYNSRVVCGIFVVNLSWSWDVYGTQVWGTLGGQMNGYAAGQPGDSGGPVVTVTHPDSATAPRQLNGIVSTGFRCGNGNLCQLGWINADPIMSHFALRLNPS